MEDFDGVDFILSELDKFPKNRVFIANPPRLQEMADCCKRMQAILDEDAKIKVQESSVGDGSVVIWIVCDQMIVYKPEEFTRAIEKSDNFEIYPQTDGLLQINILFNKCYVEAPNK